jgi:hypothetical protein
VIELNKEQRIRINERLNAAGFRADAEPDRICIADASVGWFTYELNLPGFWPRVAAIVDALRAEGILPPPAEAPWPQPTAASLEEMRERLAGVWIGNPDEGGDWPEMVSVPIEMAARLKTYADFAAPHYRNAGLLIAEEDAVALGKVLADRNGWEAPTAGEEPKGTEEGEG